jgi:hypothetical protein
MKTPALAAVAALALAGCAADPSTIAPAYVSPTAYAALDCSAMNAEAARLSARLAAVTGQQQEAASSDAALTAVTLILFWPAIFWIGNGDQSDELARLRGEAEALQAAAVARGC